MACFGLRFEGYPQKVTLFECYPQRDAFVSRLPPAPNQIHSRIWYAFSLFFRKFYSVNPFDDNFCESGRAQFAEKKMNFPISGCRQNVFYFTFSNSNSFRTLSGAVHDERVKWTFSRHGLCSKTWNPREWRWKLCQFQHGESISVMGTNLFEWKKYQKLQGHPQKDVFVLMLPTENRFVSELPTENRNCLSLPTKEDFWGKVTTEKRKRLEATHLWKVCLFVCLFVCEIEPFIFFVFVWSRHTSSAPSTSGTHTGDVQ